MAIKQQGHPEVKELKSSIVVWGRRGVKPPVLSAKRISKGPTDSMSRNWHNMALLVKEIRGHALQTFLTGQILSHLDNGKVN